MILGINSSFLEKPRTKRHQKQLKQFQNQGVLGHSQTQSSILQKADGKCANKVTFDFDSINGGFNDNEDVQRIHAKNSMKRVGRKVIFQNGHQKQPKKHKQQHSNLNLRVSEATNILGKNELQGSSQNTLLNIKSYRSSQQSEEEIERKAEGFQKHQRYSSTLVEMIQKSDQKKYFIDSLYQKARENHKYYALNDENNQRSSCREGSNKTKIFMKFSNINKKEKLHSKSQAEPSKSQFLLKGSQKSKHIRPCTSKKNKKQTKSYLSQKPQSPNISFLCQKPTSQNKCSVKDQNKCFLNYREIKRFKEESFKILRSPYKKQKQLRHTSKQKFSQKLYSNNSPIIFDSSPTLTKYKTLKQNSKKATNKDYAKQNENLHQILSQCDKNKTEKNLIDSQVTALKYCCEKIAFNLQKFKHDLNNAGQF